MPILFSPTRPTSPATVPATAAARCTTSRCRRRRCGCLGKEAEAIGNLADIGLRALYVLSLADTVACEDTRHTGTLLGSYGLHKPLLAVHEHNEQQSAQLLLQRIQQGEQIALITDAGTPGISDPGAVVVDVLISQGVKVVPIPGASAVIAALSASGITKDAFMFVGFLPASASQRRKKLETLQVVDATLVFYEAPHRVVATVEDLIAGSTVPISQVVAKPPKLRDPEAVKAVQTKLEQRRNAQAKEDRRPPPPPRLPA